MELYNDELLPYIMGLKNTVETYDKNMTPDTLIQTQRGLNSIVLRLNSIHNSSLPINKVVPDILHDIFVLAVQTSSSTLASPAKTAVRISSVCHHWRTCALEWSTLWSFIDIPYPRRMLDLFMNRSRDVPLTSRWSSQLFDYGRHFNTVSSTIPYIFSRSSSITLRLSFTDLFHIQRILKKSKTAPLQLQCLHSIMLKVKGSTVYDRRGPIILTDHFPVDISCLLELKMRELHLPWLSLPSNRLTILSLTYSVKYPNLSQLLVFLSNCPLLRELELNMLNRYADNEDGDDSYDDDGEEVDEEEEEEAQISTVAATRSMNGLPIGQVNLYNLKNLILKTEGTKGSHYIQELSVCIRAPNVAHLRRYYNDYVPRLSYSRDLGIPYNYRVPQIATPFNIFESIPSGILSSPQFTGLTYLSIIFRGYGGFKICARYERSPAYTPLDISGELYESKFDHSRIIELIRIMPKLTHLSLSSPAWSIFTSMSSIEIRALFPRLRTLELSDCQMTKLLKSPLRYLKPKTLILDTFEGTSSDDDAFLDAVLKIGVKVLMVEKAGYSEARDSKLINVLLTKRIRVWLK